MANLDTIEIQDSSTATVTLGFSLANVVLTDGTLNLTVNDQDRCTGTLNFANGTHFILNSASGFDMTIVSPTGSMYVLYTRCTEVTSNEVMQLCYIADQLLSVEDYQFTYDDYSDLRKYDSFDNIDFLRDFMLGNNVVEKFIKYHFLEINVVAKSLDGSDLAILGDDLTVHMCEFLKSSDIELTGDIEFSEAQ